VRCDQGLEGEFNRLCTIASGFADRRNEVAHGIVMEVGAVQFFTQRLLLAMPGRKQHLVVPPYHSIRKHDFVGMPSFAYNAEQLKTLARRLIAFGGEIVAYRERL